MQNFANTKISTYEQFRDTNTDLTVYFVSFQDEICIKSNSFVLKIIYIMFRRKFCLPNYSQSVRIIKIIMKRVMLAVCINCLRENSNNGCKFRLIQKFVVLKSFKIVSNCFTIFIETLVKYCDCIQQSIIGVYSIFGNTTENLGQNINRKGRKYLNKLRKRTCNQFTEISVQFTVNIINNLQAYQKQQHFIEVFKNKYLEHSTIECTMQIKFFHNSSKTNTLTSNLHETLVTNIFIFMN
eukprot:TRINITY_DN11685_c0_g2_i1.p2 TRINITY_DN11685_c0_g2~~TRINITY_DN11685_c0_g2_i1.p2  ORF type:complete len:239 (+),score=-17.76 TRINITY_DN11685_c0_g2_i1:1251-1967(+)